MIGEKANDPIKRTCGDAADTLRSSRAEAEARTRTVHG